MDKGKIDQLMESLEQRQIEASYYEGIEEAGAGILEKIEPGASVGIGGSITIQQLDLLEQLKLRNCTVNWHWLVPLEERRETCKKAAWSDYYLCSANAVTENGKIVNVDGNGNRVSSMVYGPERVIIVIGTNKIVSNVKEALNRIKKIAAPLNAKRLGLDTPCSEKGRCENCELMCRITTIIEARPHFTQMEMVIVNANLGY